MKSVIDKLHPIIQCLGVDCDNCEKQFQISVPVGTEMNTFCPNCDYPMEIKVNFTSDETGELNEI